MPQPLQLLHREDPVKRVMREVWPQVKDIKIRPYDVMLAIYLREQIVGDKITLGGVFLPNSDKSTVGEDKFQGKVGWVMKVGSSAFTPDVTADGVVGMDRWGDFKPKKGDLVAAKVGDMFKFDLPGGWRVGIVEDGLVQLLLPEGFMDKIY
jgi:hypothetical protein